MKLANRYAFDQAKKAFEDAKKTANGKEDPNLKANFESERAALINDFRADGTIIPQWLKN